ncbi:MAG: response regulator transcription factor [Gemmatimonadaceae bacterium]|nr:response regulator transcription factor [Gemmatimonadaceae bacterium]
MTGEAPRQRILVVEDRADVLDVVVRTLESHDYEVLSAQDGERGLALALDARPDLLILDLVLPRGDGLEVARQLRERGFVSPMLMLTARVTVHDRVAGLDAGADDYLVKPFDEDELLARVRALLRRASIRDDGMALKVGDLVLDPVNRRVTRGGQAVTLTLKEFGLLEHFMRHAGRPVTREQATTAVWRTEFDPATNIVDVYVNYLRKKLDDPGEPSRIQTIRGIGYQLRAS